MQEIRDVKPDVIVVFMEVTTVVNSFFYIGRVLEVAPSTNSLTMKWLSDVKPFIYHSLTDFQRVDDGGFRLYRTDVTDTRFNQYVKLFNSQERE